MANPLLILFLGYIYLCLSCPAKYQKLPVNVNPVAVLMYCCIHSTVLWTQLKEVTTIYIDLNHSDEHQLAYFFVEAGGEFLYFCHLQKPTTLRSSAISCTGCSVFEAILISWQTVWFQFPPSGASVLPSCLICTHTLPPAPSCFCCTVETLLGVYPSFKTNYSETFLFSLSCGAPVLLIVR